jgi:ATP-dependent Clp protease ATP-binding subunit ClpA
VIRDDARDQALAIAKEYSHPEVDLRHVLWGLVRALGTDAPPEVTPASIRALLEPHGTAYLTPTISEAAEKALSEVDSIATAKAKVVELFGQLNAAPVASTGGAPQTGATVETTASTPATATATATGAPKPPDTTESILAELDALVGLDVVKAEVRRLIAVERLNAERKAASLPVVNPSHDVVFTGSPGTGKTTVARIIARLYATIGVVSKGHLIEASRADLVAGYVGQTALKVKDVIDRAIGGVLFIDEAYSLFSVDLVDFGNEAIATLVKMMDDHRADLAVIVAGYPDEMRRFIESNPGLRSRFTNYIAFPDYTVAELVRIFETFAADAKVTLGPSVGDGLAAIFKTALGLENFGNARYARSLFEGAYANMAARAYADGRIERDEIEEMVVADLPPVEAGLAEPKHHIGFRPPTEPWGRGTLA